MITFRKQTAILVLISIMLVLCFTNTVFGSTEDGMAAFYKFDGDLADSSGNGNNGTAVGNITFVPGINGNAAAFDGSSYIEVPDSASLDLTKTFSISVWVYKDFNSLQNKAPIVTKQSDQVIKQYPYNFFDKLQQPNLSLGITTGAKETDSRVIVDMHKWELLTYTYDGSTVTLYVGGENKYSMPYNNELLVSTGKLFIGKMFMSKDYYYKGYMDDLRIYNKTLSSGDVTKLYNDIVNGTGKDIVIKPKMLLAHYRLNGDLTDFSGNKNDATLVGNEKYVLSMQGKGFVFDGETYLEVPDSDTLEVDTGLTVSAWIKSSVKSNSNEMLPILDRVESSVQTRQSSYQFYARIFGSGAGGSINLYLQPTGWQTRNLGAPMGKWALLTSTYEYKTKTITHYLNGTKVDVNSNPQLTLVRHSGGKLRIGMMNSDKFFKGIMDDVRIYNYPMDLGQVKGLYAYRDKLAITNTPASLMALKAKGKLQLKVVQVSPEKGEAPLDVSALVQYTSSNTKVVKIAAGGALTAMGKGVAKITVSNGIITATANVKVN